MQDPDYCLFPFALKLEFRQRCNCSYRRQDGEVDAYVNTDKLQIQDILLPYWLVCTILCLEDYSAGFMADKAVPAARFD